MLSGPLHSFIAHKHNPVYPGQIHATALLDLLQHYAVLCLALILTDNIIGKEPEDSLLRQHVHM